MDAGDKSRVGAGSGTGGTGAGGGPGAQNRVPEIGAANAGAGSSSSQEVHYKVTESGHLDLGRKSKPSGDTPPPNPSQILELRRDGTTTQAIHRKEEDLPIAQVVSPKTGGDPDESTVIILEAPSADNNRPSSAPAHLQLSNNKEEILDAATILEEARQANISDPAVAVSPLTETSANQRNTSETSKQLTKQEIAREISKTRRAQKKFVTDNKGKRFNQLAAEMIKDNVITDIHAGNNYSDIYYGQDGIDSKLKLNKSFNPVEFLSLVKEGYQFPSKAELKELLKEVRSGNKESLGKIVLANQELSGKDFDFSGIDLGSAIFADTSFGEGCDFQLSSMPGVTFLNCKLENKKLNGVNMHTAYINKNTSMKESDLRPMSLRDAARTFGYQKITSQNINGFLNKLNNSRKPEQLLITDLRLPISNLNLNQISSLLVALGIKLDHIKVQAQDISVSSAGTQTFNLPISEDQNLETIMTELTDMGNMRASIDVGKLKSFVRGLKINNGELIIQDLDVSLEDRELGQVIKEINKISSSKLNPVTLLEKIQIRSDLTGSKIFGDLSESKAQYVNLSGSLLNSSKWNDAVLDDADLSYTELRSAKFNNAQMQRVDLTRAGGSETEFNKAQLQLARLCKTNFDFPKFNGAQMRGVDLSEATLNEAQFGIDGEAVTDLSEAAIYDTKLVKPSFNKTNLTKANLVACKMLKPSFKNCNLRDASLRKTIIAGGEIGGINQENCQGLDLRTRAGFIAVAMPNINRDNYMEDLSKLGIKVDNTTIVCNNKEEFIAREQEIREELQKKS